MTPAPLLLVAAVGTALGILLGRFAPRLWLGVTLGAALAALAAAGSVLAGGAAWDWRSSFSLGGQPLHLQLDGLSAFFMALLCVIGGTGAWYGSRYWTGAEHPNSARAGRMWWSVLLLSLGNVLLTANGLHFLIAWEIFAISAYFLITLNRQQSEVRAAGWLYLVASHAATLALFAFFASLAAQTGSWELGPMKDHPELTPLFWFALFGFGVKAGLFPLHIWLPSAHANAPSHVSALMSGVAIKMGLYGLIRFTGWLPTPPAAGWVVATLGVVSAVLGVAFALGQHDLKRLLAYHSVENVGIILIGIGFALVAAQQGHPAWGGLVLAGGLLHVWNHGVFKALLFFGAGSVLHATGTREMSRLGGLWRLMPWTTGLFALGAAAIAGLPPLNGFVSEWLVYLGLFDATISHTSAAWAAIPAAILLGVTGALALACFVKVCGVVFLGAPRSRAAARAQECAPAMRGAMLVLALACVAIGLAPVIFWPFVARAAAAWQPTLTDLEPPASLQTLGWVHLALAGTALAGAAWLWRHVAHRRFTRALTWDCAYAMPTPHMQYTAGSFAATINEWFAWGLRPERHAQLPVTIFPASASLNEHTPETVLEKIVQPVAWLILRGAHVVRRLQHGRVQFYLLYLLTALGALAALVLWSGPA